MTRCIEFYEKWSKEPNFCQMTASSMSRINGYIELIEKLEKEHDVSKELTIGKLSEGAARPVATLRDGEFKNAAVRILASDVKTYTRITGNDVKELVDSLTFMPPSQQEGRVVDNVDEPEPVHYEVSVQPVQQDDLSDLSDADKKAREAWANAREKANEKAWASGRDKAISRTLDSIIQKKLDAINAEVIDAMSDVGEREYCYQKVEAIRDHCDKVLNGRKSARFKSTCCGWTEDI